MRKCKKTNKSIFFQSSVQSSCFGRGEIGRATSKRIAFDFKGNKNYHRKGKGNSISDWEKFEKRERESIHIEVNLLASKYKIDLEHRLDVFWKSLRFAMKMRIHQMVLIDSLINDLCRWSRRTRPRRWRLTGSSRRWWSTACAWSCTRSSPSSPASPCFSPRPMSSSLEFSRYLDILTFQRNNMIHHHHHRCKKLCIKAVIIEKRTHYASFPLKWIWKRLAFAQNFLKRIIFSVFLF